MLLRGLNNQNNCPWLCKPCPHY